jgi:hypothetical protein
MKHHRNIIGTVVGDTFEETGIKLEIDRLVIIHEYFF